MTTHSTFYVIRHQGNTFAAEDIGLAVDIDPTGSVALDLGNGAAKVRLDAGEARELATLILEELADRFES